MRCSSCSADEVKFVCNSRSCLQTLCGDCWQPHRKAHSNVELLPIQKALLKAESNLYDLKQSLNDVLTPFDTRNDLRQMVKQQEDALRKEKQRLIDIVSRQIDDEINKLRQANRLTLEGTYEQEEKIKTQLKSKLKDCEDMQRALRNNSEKLRQALALNVEQELLPFSLAISGAVNISSHYQVFENLKHELMLSSLTLKTNSTRIKPTRKVMNESPLHFLIDPLADSGHHLFFFVPRERLIRIYDVAAQTWRTFHSHFELPEQAAVVHDPIDNVFYCVGGVIGRQKQDSIISFSLQRCAWQKDSLRLPRSSCMATLIRQKAGSVEQKAILIAGGINQAGDVLKSSELFNIQTGQSTFFGEMNFASCSGTLVTYNGTTALRIGGLSKSGYSRAEFSVVQVAEKLDCSNWVQQADQGSAKWRYVELEVPVKGEFDLKPKLFYANQAAIQINPRQLFVFGGLSEGMQGTTETYIIGVEEFQAPTRQLRSDTRTTLQQRFCVRWPNEKPLISNQDFGGLKPTVYNGRLYTFQNVLNRSNNENVAGERRLLEFDMLEWSQTEHMSME